MQIGHFQFEWKPGDDEANLCKLIDGLRKADEQQIDIVSFPDSILTGYDAHSEQRTER